MLITRAISEPIRHVEDFAARWEGSDDGLILCWERGREIAKENPALSLRAKAGELVPLVWKGGLDKAVQGGRFGTLKYLATWQGLRHEPLEIVTDKEHSLVCTRFNTKVVFTADMKKFAKV